jgi:hypothetical protein
MGEITLSEVLTYGLLCIALPAFFVVTVFVFISSYRANRRIGTFTSSADESMEMIKKEFAVMEEVVTHQKETNDLLREIIAKLK